MKNKQLKDETHDKNLVHTEHTESTSAADAAKKRLLNRKFGLILGSLIIVAGITTVLLYGSQLFHQSVNAVAASSTDAGTSESQISTAGDLSLHGLPVQNVCVAEDPKSEWELAGGVTHRQDLISLMEDDALVVVKVDSTRPAETSEHGKQVANVTVLKTIYGNITTDTIEVLQYNRYVSSIPDKGKNLLREGGVYILPLHSGDNNQYSLDGDIDFLLEVDDSGKLFSHTVYKEFNQYDGKEANVLISKLQAMACVDDFVVINSPIRDELNGCTLDDITITDKSLCKDEGYQNYYDVDYTINEVLSTPKDPYSKPLEGAIKEDINPDALHLDPGKRYLVFVVSTGFNYLCDCAEIEPDETIKVVYAYGGISIFKTYDGKNISEIKALVPRLTAYNESHPKNENYYEIYQDQIAASSSS